MKSIQIAICHRDSVYAKALAEGLAARWRKAEVQAVDPDCPDLLAGADLILCSDRDSAMGYGPRGVHLYDDPEDAAEGCPAIHRFQPLRKIVGQMKSLAGGTEEWGKALADPSDTIFWGFTSGAGGSGTTSLAVAAGRVLCRLQGSKALLLSFSRFSGGDRDYGFEPGGLSAAQYLYRVATEGTLPDGLLQNCVQKDAYDLCRLGVSGTENPLCFAAEEDLYRLLRHAASCGGFAHILLDIPSGIPCWKSLMRLCERQIVNFGCRPHRFPSSEALEDTLKGLCESDGIDPRHRIFSFRPMEDPDSFPQYAWGGDVDIHGQFGAEVRALVDRTEKL